MHLLIVDDERLTREGLIAHVAWAEAGITSVATAGDGLEALAEHAKQRADLILCDVRMPHMDGLSFVERLRSMGDNAPVIFLSGYSDKEYLRAAIRYHAVDYLDKPVNFAELLTTAKAALAGAQAERPGASALLSSLPQLTYAVSVRAALFLFPPAAHARQEERRQSVQDAFNSVKACAAVVEQLPAGLMTVLALRPGEADRSGDLYGSLLSRLPPGDAAALLLGAPRPKASDLPAAMDALRRQCDLLFLRGWSLYQEGPPTIDLAALCAVAAEDILSWRQRGPQYADETLGVLCERIRHSDGVGVPQVRSALHSLVESLHARLSVPLKMQPGAYLSAAETLDQFMAQVRGQVHAALSAARRKDQLSPAVSATMTAIEQNLSSELTLEQLARQAFLSPTYLSAQFKAQTGVSISQYVGDMRILRAKALLLDPHVRLYEVSRLVGVPDASYFSRLFKKATGMTPSEYREANLP